MKNMLLEKQKRQLFIILLSFGLFSFSRGLWYNYQSLWLQDNQLSIATISTITGLGSLLSVSVIFLLSNLVKRKILKNFITSLLIFKSFILFLLFLLNGTSFYIIMKFLIMVDLVVDTYISISIYPVISLIKKSDVIYSVKGIVSSSFYDLGLLCSGLFLGKILVGINVTYNVFLFAAFIFTVVAALLMLFIHLDYISEEKNSNDDSNSFGDFIEFLNSDRISKYYFGYVFLVNVSFYAIYGLRMLLLTNVVMLGVDKATSYLLIVGIVADIVSILVLKYFTSKKFFVNVMVKFGGRFILCLLAFITNNVYIFMLALFYIMLFSESYNNVTDAPYINRIDNKYQFSFINLKGMLGYLAQAIGIWICGIGFNIGIRYMFLFVTVIIFIHIYLMIKINKIRVDKEL